MMTMTMFIMLHYANVKIGPLKIGGPRQITRLPSAKAGLGRYNLSRQRTPEGEQCHVVSLLVGGPGWWTTAYYYTQTRYTGAR